MKKTMTAVALFLLLIAGATAKSKTFECQWLQAPITIDGLPMDWGTAAMESYKDLGIDYSFQNDAANLYLIFTFNDPRYVSTLNYSGLTIWINLEGKNKKKDGIKFMFKAVPAEAYIQLLEMQQGKPLGDEEKARIRQQKMQQVKQCYLADAKETPIPNNSPFNPEFAIRRNGPKLTLEFKIPYRYIDAVNPGSAQPGLASGQQVAIGFEWGGMTDKMRGEMLKEPIDSGKRRADGTGSLTNGSETREQGSLLDEEGGHFRGPKKYDFWVSLKLAQK